MSPILHTAVLYIPWTAVIWVSWDAFSPLLRSRNYLLASLALLTAYTTSSYWRSQVTSIVPGPYLDEIFHIPQAQAYCIGDFHIWDPKLTTPPGLYGLATFLANLGGIRSCEVSDLRFFNNATLLFCFAYAFSCRSQIAAAWKDNGANVLHMALNVTLFPPLFFFAGLYYTDILSTCVVLRIYKLQLEKKGGIWLYLAGLLALTMRQTNIFWVAVFLGGMEIVKTFDALGSLEVYDRRSGNSPETWKDIASRFWTRSSKGQIYDVPLGDAEVYGGLFAPTIVLDLTDLDYPLCALSIVIAILYHPLRILKKVWPFIALLVSFAAFVAWNGGVVLGDKSNHVATLHLPQMLYLWPFIAFFSLPLLLPTIFGILESIYTLLLHPRQIGRIQVNKLRIASWVVISALVLVITLGIIKFNTIIHPFILADNRHYIFYVFRYTILRHPLIRYLLAPVYLLAFWLCYRTLTIKSSQLREAAKSAQERKVVRSIANNEGPRTSFFLIWVLTTALSLITAPLIEPRYFILPWLIWRLHVPSLSISIPVSSTSSAGPRGRRQRKGAGVLETLKIWVYKGHDYRLWVETFWFLIVNAITGYVFLYRGFEWKQEPGLIQRFMW